MMYRAGSISYSIANPVSYKINEGWFVTSILHATTYSDEEMVPCN